MGSMEPGAGAGGADQQESHDTALAIDVGVEALKLLIRQDAQSRAEEGR